MKESGGKGMGKGKGHCVLFTVTPATFGLEKAIPNYLMRNCTDGVILFPQKYILR